MLKRLWIKALFMLALLVSLVFLPGAACGSEPSSISKVISTVRSSTQVKNTTIPKNTSAPAQPQGALASSYVCGNASPDFPAGDPGKVSIVLSKMESSTGFKSSTIYLILRNNTSSPISEISVSAAAYTADGKLFATGSDQGFKPKYVAPGEIAMGYVYFSDASLPQDAKVEYEIKSYGADPDEETGDLEIIECNVVENRIMGMFKNTGNKKVTGPISVHAFCFDQDSNFLSIHMDFTDKDDAEPGDTIPFQVSLSDDACPVYLVAGSGYAW